MPSNSPSRAPRAPADADRAAEAGRRGEPGCADRGKTGAARPKREASSNRRASCSNSARARPARPASVQIGRGIGETLGRETTVDADADDDRERPPGDAAALDQQARELGAVDDEIVRPFELRRDAAPRSATARAQRNAGDKAELRGAMRDGAGIDQQRAAHKDCPAANASRGPCRPRPAVCSSATIHSRPGSPARRAPRASSLVRVRARRNARRANRRSRSFVAGRRRSVDQRSKQRLRRGHRRVGERRRRKRAEDDERGRQAPSTMRVAGAAGGRTPWPARRNT